MLEIKDLRFTVQKDGQDFHILKKINLSFEDNKFYVITGPFAKLIMGIEPGLWFSKSFKISSFVVI